MRPRDGGHISHTVLLSRRHSAIYYGLTAEGLIDYDEAFQIFRSQHFKLAQRMIGPGSIGTGGTPMELLERTLKDVFYPELWEVRNQLTRIADEQGLK